MAKKEARKEENIEEDLDAETLGTEGVDEVFDGLESLED